jgi:mycothiol synthase
LEEEDTLAISFGSYADAAREEVLALWREALPLDVPSPDIFETRVLLDDNFDPENMVLARESGALAGFVIGFVAKRLPLGDADPRGTRSWITVLAVDPHADQSAVGRVLIAEIERRFRSAGKSECYVCSYPPAYFTPGIDRKASPGLLELFRLSGYVPFHEAISMDAPLVLFQVSERVKTQEQRLREQGIEIRPYRRSDLVRFLAFLERSMPTDWVRVERRNLRKIPEGGFHVDQVTVVTHSDEIIGYCQFEGSHFGPFGVSDEFQGKGIGTVLLARTLERMKQAGYHDAWVMWTDDVAARVYGKFGFAETRRFVLLKKELHQ